MFQTYVAEVLSCCNIRRRRKRAHVDAVPVGVAVPTYMHISMHEAHNCMHRRTSMQGRVCRRKVACGIDFCLEKVGHAHAWQAGRAQQVRRTQTSEPGGVASPFSLLWSGWSEL